MKSSPLSSPSPRCLQIQQCQRLNRQIRTLTFQLSKSKEKNLELQTKIKLIDAKYIDMEKQLIKYKQINRQLEEDKKQMSIVVQQLNIELKQIKQNSKSKQITSNQNILSKIKIFQNSIPREDQYSMKNQKPKRLPELKLINNIQNYQINNQIHKNGDSPMKYAESRLEINETNGRQRQRQRERRWKDMMSSYQMITTQKNQVEQECQFLLLEMNKLKEYISQLQSINHLLKQQVLEYKVRLNCTSSNTKPSFNNQEQSQEQQETNRQIEIQVLTQSTNKYYNLLQQLISIGHSKQSTLKMKQILNLVIQELNQVKNKIEINYHLQQLQYKYRQQNSSNSNEQEYNYKHQQKDLIQRRKSIQQYRNKLIKSKQKIDIYHIDKEKLIYELKNILKHEEKMVIYSLDLQKKVRSQQNRQILKQYHRQQQISFKKTSYSNRVFQKNQTYNYKQQDSSNKRRISFYQNSQAEDILKDVANKDKQMVERALKSDRYLGMSG